MAPDLSPAECRQQFGRAERVVLGTAGADGLPHLVPVTFALLRLGGAGGTGDVVVSAVDHKPKRTTHLRRLRNIHEQPRVSLLADGWSSDWTRLWWVRADARAEVLDAEASGEASGRRRDAVEALVERYAQYRQDVPRGAVVWAAVDRWVGWCGGDQGMAGPEG